MYATVSVSFEENRLSVKNHQSLNKLIEFLNVNTKISYNNYVYNTVDDLWHVECGLLKNKICVGHAKVMSRKS